MSCLHYSTCCTSKYISSQPLHFPPTHTHTSSHTSYSMPYLTPIPSHSSLQFHPIPHSYFISYLTHISFLTSYFISYHFPISSHTSYFIPYLTARECCSRDLLLLTFIFLFFFISPFGKI